MSAYRPRSMHDINRYLPLAASYLLIAGMMACIAVTLAQLVTRFTQVVEIVPLVLLSFAVSLESLVSSRLIASWNSYTIYDLFLYRLTEWVVLLIGVRLFNYSVDRSGALFADLGAGPAGILRGLSAPGYLIMVGFAILSWVLSAQYSEPLFNLEYDPKTLDLERDGAVPSDRNANRKELIGLVFGIGSILLVLIGLLHLNLEGTFIQAPTGPVSTWPLVVYFCLGLALIAQSRYAVLQARWYKDRVPITSPMLRPWIVYSLIAFAAAGVVVVLLPTRFSIGLFALLQSILGILMAILVFLQVLVLAPLLVLLEWLFRLFGNPFRISPETPLLPQATPPPSPPVEPIAWLELLKSLAFWGIFLFVIVFSLKYYFSQRSELTAAIRQLPFVLWLSRLWSWVRGRLQKTSRVISTGILANLRRRVPGRSEWSEDWSELDLPGRLAPRQHILHIYLRLLKRASRYGIPRRASQTPTEYARTLTPAVPEVPRDQLSHQRHDTPVPRIYNRCHAAHGQRAVLPVQLGVGQGHRDPGSGEPLRQARALPCDGYSHSPGSGQCDVPVPGWQRPEVPRDHPRRS